MPEVVGVPFTVQSPDGPITLERKNGTAVFQGDIVLTEAQVEALRGGKGPAQASSVSASGAGLATLNTMWPSETVYYVVNNTLPSQARVMNAISHWQTFTNLRFVQRTNQNNYVEFVRGTGCSSRLGMTGGRQVITLEDACDSGNIIHEIGHAIGLLHEQTRLDRDSFVRIHWNNIQSGQSHNFERYDQAGHNGFDRGPFDFNSIMMYHPHSFSSNGQPTITRLDGSLFSTQHTALSPGDLNIINWMYGGLYASVQAVETERRQDPWSVYVATDHYVTFWADRGRTVPATLGSVLQLNYFSGRYEVISHWTMLTNLSTTLQPGIHSYYLGNQVTEECLYGANGNPEHVCYSTWLGLREGFNYAGGY
ncbi:MULTISPECIES: M12 family metallopeptidase [Corallococcus]|nr:MULTISPECIES: M12 family metallopeptidase [Corallococcus]